MRITRVQSSRVGNREDLGGMFFRSAMEANLARMWNFLIVTGTVVEWRYEPQEFDFGDRFRKNRFYVPDFKIIYSMKTNIVTSFNKNVYSWIGKEYTWVEAKGYMDNDSKVRIGRFFKMFPDEPLRIIEFGEYKEIKKTFGGLVKFE